MNHIPPTNDLAFKKVFASNENKDILIGLINDFFNVIPEEIIIENPYSIDDYKELIKGDEITILRQTLRDVSASFKIADLTMEMQIKKSKYFDERSLYYTFDRYCQNYNNMDIIKIDSSNKINRYKTLKPVYSLNILGYSHFFEDNDALRIFELYDPQRNKKFSKDLIKICFFELTKSNIETKNQKYWHDYFTNGIVDQTAPVYIKKAVDIIKFANLCEEEQKVVRKLEKAQAIYDAGLADAFFDGKAEGIVEGKAEGILEGEANAILRLAKSLLDSLDINTISQKTGLSIKILEQLKLSRDGV